MTTKILPASSSGPSHFQRWMAASKNPQSRRLLPLRSSEQRCFSTSPASPKFKSPFRQSRRLQSAAAVREDEYSFVDHNSTPAANPSPVYVAATRQHVGKTSASLALLSGLQKRFENVGFMKPVGQQSLTVKNAAGKSINVDKDAVLVKEHFGLDHLDYQHMSPVLIPQGYTRDYLDGKIGMGDQEALVQEAYRAIRATSDVILCEGTGHCAVGSIVHASNAQVASWLGAKMILVANGGLGNTFDELTLNKVLCDKEGVDIAGVIINKVQTDKVDQTQEYIQKAMDLHWGDVPLLGCIPDRPFLGCPALSDLEGLFGTKLLTGTEHRLRHYQIQDLNLVATSRQVFEKTLKHNPARTLYVAHSSRKEILLSFLQDHAANRTMIGCAEDGAHQAALVVTGTDEYPLSEQVLEWIDSMSEDEAAAAPPVILAPHPTNKVMDMIHRHTPKLNYEDAHRANKAIEHYEPHIDFDLLLARAGYPLAAEGRV
jgi:dethiobiotin synthetase